MESVANWRAANNGKLSAVRGNGGGGKVVRGKLQVQREMPTLGWPLGSMDGQGNAGGRWRGGERNGSWTGLLETMETLH